MVVRMMWHGRPAHVPISTGKLPVSHCPILMRGTSPTNRACAPDKVAEPESDLEKTPSKRYIKYKSFNRKRGWLIDSSDHNLLCF